MVMLASSCLELGRLPGWKLWPDILASSLLFASTSFRSQEMTLPNMTTPFPSMNATRDKPSQFLKVSHTKGCGGAKLHWAISLDFNECGSSIFLPPVSLPIFHLSFEIRHADRPQRTKPIGE